MKSLILIVVSLITLPGSLRAETGVTDNEVVIGAHSTESGPLAGQSSFSVSQSAYYEMINSLCDGKPCTSPDQKKGIHGRTIKFIRKDTQSLVPKTVEAIRDLVEKENVFAIVGGAGTSHVAVYKYLEEKGVPDFYFADFLSVYNDPSLKNIFPFYNSAASEAKTTLNFALKKKKNKVCVIYTKDAYGEEYLKSATETAKAKMGLVAAVEKTALQADSDIIQFKDAKCDVVMATTPAPITANMINYGANQGYKPTWVVSVYNANSKFLSLLNEGANNEIISSSHIVREPSMVVNKKGWDEYEALMNKNKLPITGSTTAGYSVAELFVETLKRAGKNLTRDSIRKAGLSYKNYTCSLCLQPLNNSAKNRGLVSAPQIIVLKEKSWTTIKK